MGLPCGDNEALGALNDLGNSLKEKLAEGKAALGDLASLQDQISAKLGELKMPELEIPASSLQEDLQALSTKLGQEFSDAQAALKEKWGDVVDDLDAMVDKIPSLDQILSGEVSLPNLCDEIPNIEMTTTTDADGNTVSEVVTKSAAALTPNVNAEAPPDFQSAINQAFSQISSGPSGESFISVAIDYGTKVEAPIAVIYGEYFNPARTLLDEMKAEWNDTAEWRQIKQLARDTGLTYGELVQNGHLTSAQTAINDKRLAYATNAADLNKVRSDTNELVLGHKKLMVGSMSQATFDEGYRVYQERYDAAWRKELLFATIEKIFAKQVEVKDIIIRFNQYKAIDTPAAETQPESSSNTYNFN